MVNPRNIKPGEVYRSIPQFNNRMDSFIVFKERDKEVIRGAFLNSHEEFMVIERNGLWLYIAVISKPVIGWITVRRDYLESSTEWKCFDKVCDANGNRT